MYEATEKHIKCAENMSATLLKPEDQQAVKEFIITCLSEFGFGYIQQYDFDLDNPKENYIDGGGMFYILKDKSKIIGTVAMKNHGDNIAELKRLYINKNYQGKGLGQMLLEKILHYCYSKNFQKIILDSPKQFATAHCLYKKMGFVLTNEDHRVFYMEKVLT